MSGAAPRRLHVSALWLCPRARRAPIAAIRRHADGEARCGSARRQPLVLNRSDGVAPIHFVNSLHLRNARTSRRGSTTRVMAQRHPDRSAWSSRGGASDRAPRRALRSNGDAQVAQPLSARDRFGRALARSIAMRRVYRGAARGSQNSDRIVLREARPERQTCSRGAAAPGEPAPHQPFS